MDFIKNINLTDMIKKFDSAKIKDTIGSVIPENWKKLDTWAFVFRRLVYIACFAWLMYLDHIVGSAYGNIQFGMRNYTGVVFAILILTAYKAKDFLKIPYGVWVVLFFVARPFLIDLLSKRDILLPRVESTVWNIGIYGIILIRMFYLYVIEKEKPKMNWPFFGIWIAMMLFMVFSVNDGTWYYWFFLIFGIFYLTNYSQKQLNCLFSGMVEGLILGFILIQWQACLYRPYDELRYEGLYANGNINALFYTVSYLAVLGKWYLMKLKRRPIIMIVPCVLLGGAIWALAVFTMCRNALITMAIMTVLFIAFQFISRKKKRFLELITNTGLILVAIWLMFEPTYNLVRYLPAYTNSPIYFVGENPEIKVQLDEAFDSEKYTEYDEMMEEAFGRFSELIESLGGNVNKIGNMLLPTLQVNASETVEEVKENSFPEELRGLAPMYPMLTEKEDWSNSVKVRMAIYEYYWKHLNLKGHTATEHGVWVSSYYNAPHAHNIWLQFTFDHGWIVGILFAASLACTIFTVVKGLITRRQGTVYYRLFIVSEILIIILAFAMFEMSWVYGQIPLTLLFIAFRVMCHKDEPKVIKEKGKADEQEQEQLSGNTD